MSAPERIWAQVEPDWHDSETGENVLGGTWDGGAHKDGTEYVRADLHEALRAENARLREYYEAVEAFDGGPFTVQMCERVNRARATLRAIAEGDA